MTPEQLDAQQEAHDRTCVWCETQARNPCGWKRSMNALREAWAEADQCICDLRAGARAADERRATINLLRERAEKAEAALDRANRLLRYVLHLRMYGENAPGGNETWRQADRDIEHHLRAIEGEQTGDGAGTADTDLPASGPTRGGARTVGAVADHRPASTAPSPPSTVERES